MENKVIKAVDLAITYKGIIFRLASLTQEINSNGYKFSFVPNYQVIEIIPTKIFTGIQGLNLDLKRKQYIRNEIPVFLQERIPPRNRVNIQNILKQYNLKYYDPLALYMLSKERYGGDNIIPIPTIEKRKVLCNLRGQTNLYPSIKKIVSEFANGNEVYIDGNKVDEKAIKQYFLPIYETMLRNKQDYQKKGAEIRKSNGTYLGRKPIRINENELFDIYSQYFYKKMSIQQALDLLDISRSSFYRKTKSFKNRMNTIGTKL